MRHTLRTRMSFVSLQLLTAFLVLLLIAGCGSSNNKTAANTPAPPSAPGGNGGGTGNPGGSGTGGSGSTVAFVYVGTNTNNGPGQIGAFSLTNDGVLHTVNGSPYNGASGFPVVTSANLFATDGTNIQTYTRNADGSLTTGPSINGVAHNDTPTGSAVGNLSLDRSGKSLYAAEINFQGPDNGAYAFFNIGSGGTLAFLANSPINVNVSPLSFSQDDRFGYSFGCYFINPTINGYTRSSNGLLTPFTTNAALPPLPFPNANLCPGPIAVSARNFLASSYNTAGQGGNAMLASYRILGDGSLALVQTATANTTALAGISGMAFDPTGNFLAIAGQGGLQIYQLAPDGTLAALGTPQLTSVSFNDVRWDHANHLYALAGSTLYIFNVNGGVATQASGSPYNVTVNGALLAVLPTT